MKLSAAVSFALVFGVSLAVHVRVAAAKGPDFNGDGFADLAIGAPEDEVDGVVAAGSVSVIYGSNSGLKANGDELWHLNKPGMPIAIQEYADFGEVLAWGDFNGDGRDDLAIASPWYELAGQTYAGIVVVLYGSASGLKTQGSQLWNQDSPGILDHAEENDRFGYAMAAGDFNHDGRDDLAIGVVGEFGDAKGAVAIIYGSPSGLTSAGDQLLHQDLPGFEDEVEVDDEFGSALAVGDFNNDNRDDLAVGVPGENVNNLEGAGAVHIIYGSNDGLHAAGNKLFHQDSPGMADDAELYEHFGSRLCTGDFDNDGRDDLAVSSYESLSVEEQGAVHVLYGSSNGLKSNGSQFWHQNKPGIADEAEPNEYFGDSLVAGDFDGDGRDDLAIGVEESVGAVERAGAVHVLYGSSSGLKSNGSQFWHQDKTGVNNACEYEDDFGNALAAGDFDGDGRDDLAIGVPGEDMPIPDDAVVNGVTVLLFGLSHNYPSDMDIMLESPTGQKVMLMSDAGGDHSITNLVITIDDAGDPMPPAGEALISGTYVPTDYAPGDEVPGVPGPYSTSLASFNGFSPVGEWKLYINDDFPTNDNGTLVAWKIVISTIADETKVETITIGATPSPYPSTITINKVVNAGAVNVLYGTHSGLKSNGDQFWHRNQPSVTGKCQIGDQFGRSM